MMELIVRATPKFFKRKKPAAEAMEFIVAPSMIENPGMVYLFLRHIEDSEYPARIRIVLTREQAKDVAGALIEFAGGAQ